MKLQGYTTGLWFVVALVFAQSGLTGCSSFRTEMGQPVPVAPTLVQGETRINSVVAELGPPNAISRLPDGCAFLYEYSRISEFQLGISLNLPVIHWFKFLKAWNDLGEEALLLTFDNQGVLRNMCSGRFKESLGGGSGIQFLFAVMSFSDSSKFLQPSDAHGWGETLLRSPPQVLNSAQSLRNGQHGLELRVAPDFAGQHTLEMMEAKTEKEKKKIKKDYQSQPK